MNNKQNITKFMFSKIIKNYRIKNNLTQSELGNYLGVTSQAISKWEKGQLPDVYFLPVISDKLTISLDILLAPYDKNFEKLEDFKKTESPLVSELELFDKIDDNIKEFRNLLNTISLPVFIEIFEFICKYKEKVYTENLLLQNTGLNAESANNILIALENLNIINVDYCDDIDKEIKLISSKNINRLKKLLCIALEIIEESKIKEQR